MGAECSVQGSYRIGEELDCVNTFWDVYPAVKKSDNREVTVFIHEKCDDPQVVEKCIKHVKTLRHPGLLKCIKIVESSSELTMVTEPVVPLKHVIGDLDIHELVAGIYNIITTIHFLHNKCKLCHQSLCLDSVLVGQNNAAWKLGGLEDLTPICNETTKQTQDLVALGKLILEIFDGVDMSEHEAMSDFRDLVEAQLLNEEQQEPVDISVLLDDELFQNGYVAILNFLTNITVKTVEEKTRFFGQLSHKLRELPASLIANRLLHLLLSRFVLFDRIAVDIFLPDLLTPKIENAEQNQDITPLLPEHIYKQSCLPILAQLFAVNDRHVRIILLRYFHLYVAMFEEDVLKNLVLNKLMIGLKDSDDELVSATFSALQFLVPILGSQVVLGGERSRQFIDSSPKFDVHESSKFVTPNPDEHTQLARNTLLQKTQSVTNSQALVKEKHNSRVNSKSLEDKMRERERRREETRKRNEERRQRSALMKLQKETVRNVIKVDETTAESDEDFQTWGDDIHETDTNVEVSDGSEYGGVPSLSEVSLDSGFCEKTRVLKTQPPPPQTSPGIVTIATESDIIATTSSPETKLSTGNTVVKTTPDKAMKLTKKVKKERDTKDSVPETKTGQSPPATAKTVTNAAPVVMPWEDFDINITSKKPSRQSGDLFSDMAPNITFAAKAPVKGTSMYSATLAVDNIDDSQVDADGWMDDDW